MSGRDITNEQTDIINSLIARYQYIGVQFYICMKNAMLSKVSLCLDNKVKLQPGSVAFLALHSRSLTLSTLCTGHDLKDYN